MMKLIFADTFYKLKTTRKAIAKIKTIMKKSQALTTMKLTLKPEHQKLMSLCHYNHNWSVCYG